MYCIYTYVLCKQVSGIFIRLSLNICDAVDATKQ